MNKSDIQERIKRIVPPLALCKAIPDGEFTETVFSWHVNSNGIKQLSANSKLARECVDTRFVTIYPAPTLEEILLAISHCGADFYDEGFTIEDKSYFYPTETDTALQQWLQIKGYRK